jgi:hypothetical protein
VDILPGYGEVAPAQPTPMLPPNGTPNGTPLINGVPGGNPTVNNVNLDTTHMPTDNWVSPDGAPPASDGFVHPPQLPNFSNSPGFAAPTDGTTPMMTPLQPAMPAPDTSLPSDAMQPTDPAMAQQQISFQIQPRVP